LGTFEIDAIGARIAGANHAEGRVLRSRPFRQIILQAERDRSWILSSEEITYPALRRMRIDHIRTLVVVACVARNLERAVVKRHCLGTSSGVGVGTPPRRNEWLRPVERSVFSAVEKDDLAGNPIEPDCAEEQKSGIGSLPIWVWRDLLTGIRLPAEEQPFDIASHHAQEA